MPATVKNTSAAAVGENPTFLDRLPVAILELDTNLKLRAANARALQFLDLRDRAAVEGRDLSLAVPAEIRDPLLEVSKRVLNSGAPATLRGLAHAGLVWDVDVNANDRGLLVTALDVTQRAKDAADAQRMAQLAAERLTVSALEAQDARDREASARAEAELRQQRLDAVFASLKKSEERFRAVLENALDAAYRRDVGSKQYEYLSPVIERITGYPAEEFLSQGIGSFLDRIHPDDRRAVDEGLQRLERGGNGSVLRYRFRCKDGSLRWLADAVVLHTNQEGRPTFYAGSIRDITEAKAAEDAVSQANARLRDADQRKNEFLAALSHELRNPLAPIRNSVYISERAAPGGEQAKRALSVIDRQVTHLGHIIDDLLDVTRISRGKIRLQPELMDLNEIVRATSEDVHGLFRDAGIGFETHVAEAPVRVLVDRTRIAQVIGNLLQNASKFTPRGGRVRLFLRATETHAVLQIQDSGVGMDPQLIHHLFEPFVQASQTIDRSRGGLGLGLALVKGLIDLHGGTVDAESEGAGKGSTFTVRLPLAQDPQSMTPGRADPSEKRRPLRVLVIEDNTDAAESLKEVLELGDHLVEVAFDGHQGIQKAKQTVPDLVLCDIGLPGADGYQVASTLRKDPHLARTTLVALSGYALQDDIERSNDAGFDRHMSKPPDMAALESLIAEVAKKVGAG